MDESIDDRPDLRIPIPKFASFRPRKPSLVQREDGYGSKNFSSKDQSPAKLGQSERTRSRERKRRHHVEKNKRSTSLSPKVSSLHHAKSQPGSFLVDKLGDPQNLIYGTLDRYATSIYLRRGAGTVIGANQGLMIDRSLSNEKGICLSMQEQRDDTGKNPLRTTAGAKLPEFRIKKEAKSTDDFVSARDFISFESILPGKRKCLHELTNSATSSSEDERTSHRTILQNSSAEEPNDPDLELAGEAEFSTIDPSDTTQDQLRRKNAELNLHLDSKPTDAEAWLQLVHNQDQMLGPRPTAAERHSTVDIKISIYEKALRTIKNPEYRQTLQTDMMEEAAKIWDSEKISTRWRSILKSNPKASRLWTAFLAFKQTAFRNFRYEDVQNTYFECISILQKSLHMEKGIPERAHLYENLVFILLRMTLYMRESGFLEIALAAWQAQLEFVFFMPPSFHEPDGQSQNSIWEKQLATFEYFWESEVPRIGEIGARGWASFDQNGSQPPEPQRMLADPAAAGGDPISVWIAVERQNLLLSRQPARTIDDVTENDPFRVVLFSDIQPFMISLPPPSCQHVLLEAFLSFCQLPSYRPRQTERISYNDGFQSNEIMNLDYNDLLTRHDGLLLYDQGVDKLTSQPEVRPRSMFATLNLHCHLDSDILFAKKGSWFSAFDTWLSNTHGSKSLIEPEWVVNASKRLVGSLVGDDLLAEYVLALELCLSAENAKKTARGLLKQRSSSLRLYNAYALIEYRLNNPSKGESALIAAINLSKDLDTLASLESILLWRTWIWELLNDGKSIEALARLQTYADAKVEPFQSQESIKRTTNPAKVLRTENGLIAFRDYTLSLQSPSHAALAMELLILFAYLKDPSTLSTALAAFTTNLALLTVHPTNTTSSEESLHQSRARLLHYHVTHSSAFKPTEIRACLTESIDQFPHNTIFLTLYAWNETRFRIDDRVRSIIQDVVLGANNNKTDSPNPLENVTSHIFALQTELSRGVTLGSNAHAIRAAFERVLNSKSGAHCAGIWKWYFLFEHANANAKGNLKRAREVWYRAIRACPWVKELYMLAFEYLRGGPAEEKEGAMREAELMGVYDMMVQKGLRVYGDLNGDDDDNRK